MVQGLYYAATGLWPMVHLHSFMLVTGDKTDTWLVKMVALLTLSIGITLILNKQQKKPQGCLGLLTAISFTVIDLYYVNTGIISKIYLLDAIAECLFIVLYSSRFFRNR